MLEQKRKEITPEVIASFLEGNDPMERIVQLEYSYQDNFMTVFYRDEQDRKCVRKDPFYPFVWATREACNKLCDGDRTKVKALLNKYNISVKLLDTVSMEGQQVASMQDGYLFLFQARRPMSNSDFHRFFKECGNPIYKPAKKDKFGKEIPDNTRSSRQYLCVTPQEQYMIETGRRFFKGYDDYDDLLRMIFDLETGGVDENGNKVSGLDPYKANIEQYGIRFNRPVMLDGKLQNFERIFNITGETKEERNAQELNAIRTAVQIIYTFDPDIVTAHNGENFDWWFIMERCKMLGTSLEEISAPFFEGKTIHKNARETVLKLGGEVETFNQTVIPGRIVTDSLHAVRRAQAIDSNMLMANLKYVTKYSKMEKPNRVYVPGDQISTVWNDTREAYAHNDTNGDWYEVDAKHPLKEGYEMKTGKYIVERYLLDDLWECDKVEHRYNTPNFLICKMLPVPFQKCCTMGTAGQWKSIMLAWSYENGLAIPAFGESSSFTGGLSRLLKVGYVSNVVKLDYNSLYPSIILTWAIANEKDVTKVMLHLLEHVLTQREKYKGLKKVAGKKAGKLKGMLEDFGGTEAERMKISDELRQALADESANDKKQLPLKIFGNSYFGSFGAPNVFPWASIECAEQTTCTGRQSLRLMISHFTNLGYQPIVGDSFSGDTPLFIRFKDTGMISIRPVEELIDESCLRTDMNGCEFDYSPKDYQVLCRSGWHDVEYIYRHETDKDMYEVTEEDMSVEVTRDHSLFNSDRKKIKPEDIDEGTRLEYFSGKVEGSGYLLDKEELEAEASRYWNTSSGRRIPDKVLNASVDMQKEFLSMVIPSRPEGLDMSKTELAGFQYLMKHTK